MGTFIMAVQYQPAGITQQTAIVAIATSVQVLVNDNEQSSGSWPDLTVRPKKIEVRPRKKFLRFSRSHATEPSTDVIAISYSLKTIYIYRSASAIVLV